MCVCARVCSRAFFILLCFWQAVSSVALFQVLISRVDVLALRAVTDSAAVADANTLATTVELWRKKSSYVVLRTSNSQ